MAESNHSSSAAVEEKSTHNTPEAAVPKTTFMAMKKVLLTFVQLFFRLSFRWLLPLLLLVVFVAAAYWGWQQLLLQQQIDARHTQSLQQQNKALAGLSQRFEQQQTQKQGALVSMQQQLQSLQQQINSQSKRLLSMSTTSKEDWKLLEARYLLRLANQRLLTERDSLGSIAQLQAADNILRDLDDISLFPIRKAINNNIAALKLAPSIDRDGVYLRLISLADNLKLLPAIKPLASSELNSNGRLLGDLASDDLLSDHRIAATLKAEKKAETTDASNGSIWYNIKHWFKRQSVTIAAFIADYVRIRHHDTALTVLSPDAQLYVNQNIRLNLEQAQLALLAEKTVIYQHSLAESVRLLHEYYQLNDQVEVFVRELQQLQQLNIRRALPDISSSLTQIDRYIERLHKLQTPANQKQAAVSAAAGEK